MTSPLAYAAALAVLAAGSSHAAPPQPIAARQAPTLVVRTYQTGALDAAERDAGLRLARTVLATAGVNVQWHLCEPDGPCQAAGEGQARITLILMPVLRATCGLALRDADGRAATILVSIPCVDQWARNVPRRHGSRAQSDPLLSTLAMSHLLGAVVAHELAHALGVQHTNRGLMRPCIGVDDVQALREGRAAFDAAQTARMQLAAAVGPGRD